MDERDLALIIIGVLIGTAIGYAGSNLIKPYVEPYIFSTTLTLTINQTATVGQTLTIYAKLDVVIPNELSQLQSYIKPQLLQDKQLYFMYKESTSNYWTLIGSSKTLYYGTEDKGVSSITFVFTNSGTYSLKVCFYGSNLLKPSESQETTVTVT